MMVRSFKLRMALLSVLTSGVILAVFAVLFLSAIRRVGIERIDRELQALGDAQVRGPPKPHRFWAGYDDSLASIYGEGRKGQFLVKVNDRDARSVYVSPRWPGELAAAALGVREISGASQEPDFRPQRFDPRSPDDNPPPQPENLGDRPPPPRERLEGGPRPPRENTTPPRFVTLSAAGRTWRFAVMGNERVTLMLGMDLADFQAEIHSFRTGLGVATPVALLLLAVGGWLLAGQAIRPVRTLTRVAAGVTARGLNQRVRTEDADHEFQALIDVINGMLDRLEKSFLQATRFSADAAHELNTPLTILQGEMEQAIQSASSEAEQQRFAGLLEEVQRLKNIIRKLLLLAQADAGQLRLNMTRVDFSAMVRSIAGDVPGLAPGIEVRTCADEGVFVTGDTALLNQALQNLVTNAVKFNDTRARVEISLNPADEKAVFTIANTGPGIPRVEQGRLFERFYRADKARNRRVDGTGLGLSLVREIARAHGGDLVLDRSDDQRTVFVLTVPLADSVRPSSSPLPVSA